MAKTGIWLGLASIIISIIFALNSFSGFTGYVILENSTSSINGIIAACFLVGGLLLIIAEKKEK
ncbi:MAG: hypothetical protein ABIH72_00765 [archaeon]